MQKKEEVEISGTAGYKRGHMGAHRAFPLSLLAALAALLLSLSHNLSCHQQRL